MSLRDTPQTHEKTFNILQRYYTLPNRNKTPRTTTTRFVDDDFDESLPAFGLLRRSFVFVFFFRVNTKSE